MDIRVYNGTSTAASSFPATFTDGTAISMGYMDLHPLSAVAHPAAFGLAIDRLATCFANWRVTSLNMEYVPLFGTSTTGVLALGFRTDARDNDAPSSVSEVASCAANIVTPVWQPCSLNLSGVLRSTPQNWYYTNFATETEESDRFSSPGSFQAWVDLGASIPAGQIVGYLRFSGTLEFKSLARIDLIGLSHHSKRGEEEKEKYLPPASASASGATAEPESQYFLVNQSQPPPVSVVASSVSRYSSMLPMNPPQPRS